MSIYKWPEDISRYAAELSAKGIRYEEVAKLLREKFPEYTFSALSTKSHLNRLRAKFLAPPKPRKWRPEISARAVELIKSGFNAPAVAEMLQSEFPYHKFTDVRVREHVSRIKRNTGDHALIFNGNKWKPEVVDRLRELVKTDKSARQIAVSLSQEFPQFSFTHSSVGGRIMRLRNALGDDSLRTKAKSPPRITDRKAPAKRNGGAVKVAINAAIKRRTTEMLQPVMNQHRIVCCGDPVSIWELNGCRCKWPIWPEGTPFSEQLYCGNKPVPGGPYCVAHEEIGYPVRGNHDPVPARTWGRAA